MTDKFLDIIQSAILDVRYENKVIEQIIQECEDVIDYPEEWTVKYDADYTDDLLYAPGPIPGYDKYGNLIGAYPIRFGPNKD